MLTADMAAVDALIDKCLSSQEPLVGQVARYIIAAGGKRVRPKLVLLLCGVLTGTNAPHPQRHALAAIVEFIHTATLLHDDVVDESALRRGRPTANVQFGNAASVLVGDFLYSRAFQMMLDIGAMRVLRILADATNVIAEGEVMQLANIGNTELTEAQYLHVVRSKTAKLFEACGLLAAVVHGGSPSIERACGESCLALGTAFQIVDDLLDYEGDTAALGKNLGDDLREGKVTLPLIIAMARATAHDAQAVRDAVTTASGGEELDTDAWQAQLQRIGEIVRNSGALAAARAVATQQAQLARAAAAQLPQNPYTSALIQLTDQLQVRST